jgi:septum formation protein
MDLILASSSPYRRELLSRLGLGFRSVSPLVDENAAKLQGLEPIDLARSLATSKARAVFESEPRAVVIGSDQVVEIEGQILGKPETVERAVEQLLALAGREHRLITAVAVADHSGIETHVDITRLAMRSLGRDEAERYVEADRPLDCAGAYKIESLGISLFDRIDSRDHTAIIGLPLLAVCGMLRARGFGVP